MKISLRSQRIASLLKEEIPKALTELFPLEKYGIISAEHIEVSGDLSFIDIYVKTFGGKQLSEKDLAPKSRKILTKILKKIPFRKSPILRFKTPV